MYLHKVISGGKLAQFSSLKMSQTQCSFAHRTKFGCGPPRGKTEDVPLLYFRDDIKNHLKSCHLSRSFNEMEDFQFILARAGLFEVSSDRLEMMFVCPSHRFNLGKYWRSLRSCQYPNHSGSAKVIKDREVINLKMVKEIQCLFGATVPFGSRKYFGLRFVIESYF